MTFSVLRGLTSIFLMVVGCAAESGKSRPPLCQTEDCVPSDTPGVNTTPSGTSVGAGGGSGSPGGAAGTGGAPGIAGASSVVVVTGRVVEVDESTFAVASGSSSAQRFVVQAPTLGGSVLEVAAASDFALDGVLNSRSAWILARPEKASDLLPGLIGFDATTTTSVVVPVVRRSSLELIASFVATTLDAARAQAVLRFVNAQGQPIAGVRAAVSGAERIVYDDLGSYSDVTNGTGRRGLAILLNVAAATTPATWSVSLSGAASGEFNLFLAAGGATIGDVVVASN